MINHTESIRRWYAEASPTALEGGRTWYAEARATVFEMSMAYGVHEETAAGVVAALSQRTRWSTNINRARHVLNGGVNPGGLPDAAAKAIAIYEGADPVATLGPRAYKLKSFYLALMGDDNSAVVDSWMLRAFNWPRLSYGPRQYRRLAGILTREARKVGLSVVDYQAIVWCQIRGAVQ